MKTILLYLKKLVYASILCTLFSCNQQNNSTIPRSVPANQQNNSTIPRSVPANPDEDKRWNELGTYDIQYEGNNIILTVVVSGYFKYYYEEGMNVEGGMIKPIKEIYEHLTSVFRTSGTRHLYVCFYDGEHDKYGNKKFPDAIYITSFQIEDVKKYKSAIYFDEAYKITKLIIHKGYPHIPMENIYR